MTEVSSSLAASLPSASRTSGLIQQTPPVAIPKSNGAGKNQFLKAEALSPVTQNGSFEFDRVLKSGEVNKRSRKTRTWKRFYLVLRPNVLSVYKSRSEEKLLKQLNLADVTAVALLKDPKGRRNYMFGIFSPSRNYHLQAPNDEEAKTWVEVIKREAKVDDDEPLVYNSVGGGEDRGPSIDQYVFSGDEGDAPFDRGFSSSPEPMDVPNSYTTTKDGVRIPQLRKSSVDQHQYDYSGAEQGSFSDFSDAGGPVKVRKSFQASGAGADVQAMQANKTAVAANSVTGTSLPQSQHESLPRPSMGRNFSGASSNMALDEERVVYHGYLLCLKSKGGVRQWKRLWTVLRPKNITFYKDENEYAAQLILPLSSILSAVEIDPISKTKSHCMQIIAEDKSYRFCAPSEEALVRWLGAVKSQLAKKKGKEKQQQQQYVVTSIAATSLPASAHSNVVPTAAVSGEA